MTAQVPGSKKSLPWNWTAEAQQAFDGIKAAMLQAPVLAFPNPAEGTGYILHTDASNYATGAVLSQEQSGGTIIPINYYSRKLNPAQVNYATHDKELLAIVEALQRWRHLCLGRPVKVATDHAALRFQLLLEYCQPSLIFFLVCCRFPHLLFF